MTSPAVLQIIYSNRTKPADNTRYCDRNADPIVILDDLNKNLELYRITLDADSRICNYCYFLCCACIAFFISCAYLSDKCYSQKANVNLNSCKISYIMLSLGSLSFIICIVITCCCNANTPCCLKNYIRCCLGLSLPSKTTPDNSKRDPIGESMEADNSI